uniref:Uncharacterized protein n=1 Tax=Glossina austeni TaxID=7395 RepID=A0A1A9V5S7_GLOAU
MDAVMRETRCLPSSLIVASVNISNIFKSPPREQIKSIGSDIALNELGGFAKIPTTVRNRFESNDNELNDSPNNRILFIPIHKSSLEVSLAYAYLLALNLICDFISIAFSEY